MDLEVYHLPTKFEIRRKLPVLVLKQEEREKLHVAQRLCFLALSASRHSWCRAARGQPTLSMLNPIPFNDSRLKFEQNKRQELCRIPLHKRQSRTRTRLNPEALALPSTSWHQEIEYLQALNCTCIVKKCAIAIRQLQYRSYDRKLRINLMIEHTLDHYELQIPS